MTGLIPPEDVQRILSYLDLPASDHLPLPPLALLTEYIPILPSSLLTPFSFIPPRQRSSIPSIKSRRLLYATSSPKPASLSADQGRLRWPLLWERMGGDSNLPITATVNDADDDEAWVQKSFMYSEDNQHVKKLGGFLRGLEEEREAEGVRAAKRMERRLDDVGEEFDSESDEEENGDEPMNGSAGQKRPEREITEDQEEVRRLFEKRLLELFLDGLDTIPYDPIDFCDPPDGDPIAKRDAEDKYFDDEEPSRTPGGHDQGSISGPANTNSGITERKENGLGEYDY